MSAARLAQAMLEVERAEAEARRIRAQARDELRAAVWEVVDRGWSQSEVARYLSEHWRVAWSRQRVWALMHERDDEYEEVGS